MNILKLNIRRGQRVDTHPETGKDVTIHEFRYITLDSDGGVAQRLVAETFREDVANIIERMLGHVETLEQLWLISRAFGRPWLQQYEERKAKESAES